MNGIMIDLNHIYKKLLERYGKQHWWPAGSKFEVIIGAVLVQRTTWRNVERAMENLKNQGLLDPTSLAKTDPHHLEKLIRPIGFYRQKATRIIELSSYLVKNFGSLDKFFNRPVEDIREELLSIRGIGLETADSILLYAAEKLIFPVDAYTRRIFTRLGLIESEKVSYEELRRLIESNLPTSLETFKEFRALIVRLGKTYCKSKPKCVWCPIINMCKFSQSDYNLESEWAQH